MWLFSADKQDRLAALTPPAADECEGYILWRGETPGDHKRPHLSKTNIEIRNTLLRWLTLQVTGRPRPAVGGPVELRVRRHFGAAGTKPYLDMTATSAALSGGPPALTTVAISLKY